MDDSTAQVFISYRRDDTGYVAKGLGDRLNARFGQIFMDIDDIDPGENFTDVIRAAVAECDVLLALIGKNWVAAADAQGHRRLEDPDDWVVQEIKTALLRGVWVIPVLVDEAKMPAPGDLPGPLKALSNRQAIRIRLESFDDDANRVMVSIRKALDSAESPTTVQRKIGSAADGRLADPAGRPEKMTADDPDALVTQAGARSVEAELDRGYAAGLGLLGADRTAPPPGFAVGPASANSGRKRRNLLLAGAGVVVLIVAGGVFLMTSPTDQSDANDQGSVAATLGDTDEPTELRTDHTGVVGGVAFSPDGTSLASAGHDKKVQVSKVADPTAAPVTFEGPTAALNGVAFSPDGKMLAAGGDDDSVMLWNVADPAQPGARILTHTEPVSAVAFSPDGKTLASASNDDTVLLWDIPSHTGSHVLRDDNTGDVTAVAFSPDSATLASTSTDGKVRLWDVRTGAELDGSPLSRAGNDSKMLCVAFSEDGTLASGSEDGKVWLWDVAGRSLRATLDGHDGGVDTVAFSRDGAMLVSGSWDHSVGLWDVADGQLIVSEEMHNGAVYSVAYSPVAPIVASTGEDGTVLLWDVTQWN